MKQIFLNLDLSKKILIAPLVVIFFLVIFGIVSYLSLSNQKTAIEDIFGTRFKSLNVSAGLIKDITNVHANLYKVISWTSSNYDAKKIEQLGKDQVKTMQATMVMVDNILQNKRLSPKEAEAHKAVQAALTSYQKDALEAIDMASGDLAIATMYMKTAEEKFQTLYTALTKLQELESAMGQSTYDSSMTSFNTSLKIFFLVLIIAVSASILLSLLIAKIIAIPVHDTMKVVKKIAEGDLTQEITITSTDEIGMLAQSVDQMRRKMGEAVGGSVAAAKTLAEAASAQAAFLEETSSSLAEMASMTKRNAASTEKANELVSGANATIEKANISMTHLTASIAEIVSASEQIQKIVKTIDEISFQTNLLALNAAVEAARAGEAGAGFAVVADEVRNLAMRAAEAAKNTSNLMTDVVGKTRDGEHLVKTTNQEFMEVKTSSHKIAVLMGDIATASAEQSEGIDQINTALQHMSSVTQKNAASADELTAIMSIFITGTGSGTQMKQLGATKRRKLYIAAPKRDSQM